MDEQQSSITWNSTYREEMAYAKHDPIAKGGLIFFAVPFSLFFLLSVVCLYFIWKKKRR